jgi:hypothetical protein
VSVARILTLLGGVSISVGIGAIAYAHVAVAPYLQRTVDVARRLIDDGAATTITLRESALSTEALRAPSKELTDRSVATLKPSIAVFEALADTLRVIPGATDDGAGESSDRGRSAAGLPGSLGKLRRSIDTLAGEAEHVRTAAIALDAETRRHPMSSLQPAIAAIGARIRETQAILADTDPARTMTLLADLIAGLYLFLGGALVAIGCAMSP